VKITSPGAGGGEPAVQLYVFGRGFVELRATVRDGWTVLSTLIAQSFDKASQPGTAGEKTINWVIGAVATIAAGVFALLASLHTAIVLAWLVVDGALVTAVLLAEKVYLTVRGFWMVCPSCHARGPLPVYLCDGCGREHRRLLPSSYGILHHLCVCGRSLPATFFVDRGRLPAKCPHCSGFLSRESMEGRKIFVPVVGGPSVGKTAYLTWLIDELRQRAAAAAWHAEFLDAVAAARFEQGLDALRHARMPLKTPAATPAAVNLVFRQDGGPQHNLYLYDAAGEAYGGESRLVPHRFMGFCSGILFLIDPFSIAAVRREYGVDAAAAGLLKPSAESPEDLLDRLVSVLEKEFRHDPASPIGVPIAVVLTKVDAFNLEGLVGNSALSPWLPASECERARSELISRQLREWNMGPLVATLETRFRTRMFFSCSAVGLRRRAGEGYAPERIGRPFFWLMEQAATGLLDAPGRASLILGAVDRAFQQPRPGSAPPPQ
jgi:hypothetical protein